ncbi:unnamed protein product [Arctia plantaginis]|uniref:Uncharacterized protein n=1 Tax=Arctia plantaginis TaxID=874455 RepID=A0A8S1B505_ARCPL|nr:unnamed protein product [Arctia plantaginis]
MASKKALRRYIQKRNLNKSYMLQDCSLVIDGNSFFKESYKNSGCHFLLGPDCNKYIIYLSEQLKCFSACNITCYVIFKGTTRDELEKIQNIHQQMLNDRIHTENSLNRPSFFEPLLVEDMQKQLLKLSGIKYFCCEYEAIEAIIGVARSFKCPVLTDNIEYCLYGVSCIPPNSITWEKNSTAVQCTIYDHDKCKYSIGVHHKMPLLLTVLSMISELPECGNIDDISSVIRWVKQQQKDVINEITNNISDLNKRKIFIDLFYRNMILYSYPSCNLAVKYCKRDKFYGLFKDDKKWFSKGVSNGRIALPYIVMKRKGLVIGSTVVNDIREHDAIEAAAPVISYAHCLLTNSQKSTLKYVGRKNTICTTWDYEYYWKGQIHNRDIFNKYGKMKKKTSLGNPFYLFIKEIISVNVAEDIRMVANALFSTELKNCIILVVTLVYYVQKSQRQKELYKQYMEQLTGAYLERCADLDDIHWDRRYNNKAPSQDSLYPFSCEDCWCYTDGSGSCCGSECSECPDSGRCSSPCCSEVIFNGGYHFGDKRPPHLHACHRYPICCPGNFR